MTKSLCIDGVDFYENWKKKSAMELGDVHWNEEKIENERRKVQNTQIQFALTHLSDMK